MVFSLPATFTVCYSLHVLTSVQKNLFQSEEMEISFSIYLEVLTLSLLPILQSFLWNPPVSHPDTVNKERVLQKSQAALSAPAIIMQRYTVSEPRGSIYAIYSLHSFFLLLFCLSLRISSFFPPLVSKKICFCVIEEGKPGQSILPRVRARILSQPACRSPVMRKRDAMKVSGVGHVPQPWEAIK